MKLTIRAFGVKLSTELAFNWFRNRARRVTYPTAFEQIYKCVECNHIPDNPGTACPECGAVDTRVVDKSATKDEASMFSMFSFAPTVYKTGVGRQLWVKTVARKVSTSVWWQPHTWSRWRWDERPSVPATSGVDSFIDSLTKGGKP